MRDALARWQAADWPLVVRRAEADLPPEKIAVAIALPPTCAGVKPRFAAVLDRSDIARDAAPITLAAALQTVPPHWRAALLALQMASCDMTAPLRLFGSLAWQTITGMSYLRPESDIDLLLAPTSAQELTDGVTLLAAQAATLPLDGEIVFPSGAAVAWKEWAAVAAPLVMPRAGMVMTKRIDRVALLPCKTLLAEFTCR